MATFSVVRVRVRVRVRVLDGGAPYSGGRARARGLVPRLGVGWVEVG